MFTIHSSRNVSRRAVRCLVSAGLAGLASLFVLVAAPSSAQAASDGAVRVTVTVSDGPTAAGLIGDKRWDFKDTDGANLGYAQMSVYSGGTKHIVVCDFHSRAISPGLDVDPSGAGAPILYWDTNGNGPGCLVRDIGYSIRKMRGAYQSGGSILIPWAWEQGPLPYPDF